MISARTAAGMVMFLTFGGCHRGDGSDIGPTLQPLENYDYRVLVRDDMSRPVTGALITISGALQQAVTGRSGRAYLREFLTGNRLVTIDGSNAASVDSSELESLTVAATLPDGGELPYAVFLPDQSGSVGLTLPTGTQSGGSTFDDSASGSGALLGVNSGDVVSHGGASTVTLRTGKLTAGHLPPTLSGIGAVTLLVSRGIYIQPASVQFATGASFSIPNDLVLGVAQTATLYHLDSSSGQWVAVGTGTETGGRIAAPIGSVASGGLYAFGVPAASTTVISGRVIDLAGIPVGEVLVRGPQTSSRTLLNGTFSLPTLARTDASGADRTVLLELIGGRDYLSTRVAVGVTLNSGSIDVGDITLDTSRVTNVRVLMVRRGVRDKNRRLRISNSEILTASGSNGGDDATVYFDDVPAESFGFLASLPRDQYIVHRNEGFLFLDQGAVDNAISSFSNEELWRLSQSNGTRVRAVGSFGTGPIEGAHAVVGDVPGVGYRGKTNLGGTIDVGIPLRGLGTVAMQTSSDGRTVTSAFSMVGPDSGRLEMPIERALRQGLGQFGRFGIYAGDLTNAVGSNTLMIRVSGQMTLQDFYDEALMGRSASLDAPVSQVPGGGSTMFRVGVPFGLGHLAGVEGTTTGGVFSLERLGLAMDLTVLEGALANQDVSLSEPATTPFQVTSALTGRDPALMDSDLRFHAAGVLPSGLVVDLVRDVGGASIAVAGADATLMLPNVPAGLDGYEVVLGGSAVIGGATITQKVTARLDGLSVPDVAMLPVPVVTSHAPGATVSSTGFTIDLSIPQECHYVVVNLRSETSSDVRDWTAVVPWENNRFTFSEFPTEVPQLLVPGRTWTLTVLCARIDGGFLLDPTLAKSQTYTRIQANWVGLGEAAREVSAISSVSFDITTN